LRPPPGGAGTNAAPDSDRIASAIGIKEAEMRSEVLVLVSLRPKVSQPRRVGFLDLSGTTRTIA
jgi:hypothetical protein